ncbi:TetR/AcrR family transcriptional regulator [Pinisolibacter sp.]|uniref:TetR/AcrR family transcriptional regulator n=1 Tax=Pinisolibacter sp. TaxID=2172024 RepID=UPI002FDEF073
MPETSTRDTILEIASRLFASNGYAAVSMRDVAARVGVTQANLYYHFKDKDHLIRDSLALIIAHKMEPMEECLKAAHSNKEKIEFFISWFVRLVFEDRVFSKMILRELLDGDEDRLQYLSMEVFKRPFALLVDVMREYTGRVDPTLSAVSVAAIILGHFQLSRILPYLPDDRADHTAPDVVARHVLAMLQGPLHDPAGSMET